MYKCLMCGATFDFPYLDHYREDMNGEGAWQDFYVHRCPVCMEEDIEEAQEDDEDVCL